METPVLKKNQKTGLFRHQSILQGLTYKHHAGRPEHHDADVKRGASLRPQLKAIVVDSHPQLVCRGWHAWDGYKYIIGYLCCECSGTHQSFCTIRQITKFAKQA